MKNALSTVFAIAAIGIAAMTLASCDLLVAALGGGQTPVAADFEIGNLSQLVDDVTAVTITPKPGKSTGMVTIYYDDGTAIPQTAGSYAVTFDVAAASDWNAASGLRAGTLTVSNQIDNPQTPVAADFEIGNLSQTAGSVTAVTIRPRQGKSTGRVTIYYNGATTIPQTAGRYAVTFDVAASLGWIAVYGLNGGIFTVTGSVYTFNSIAEFSTWLAGQSANSVYEPYNVKLNVGDLGGAASVAGSVGYVLNANSEKYVNLDLSSSTITAVPELAFSVERVEVQPGVTTTYRNGVLTLVGITLPDTVTEIGDRAFTTCTNLANIDMGNGLINMGESIFSGCYSLSNVTIPGSLNRIGGYVFSGCYGLTSVTIKNGVSEIGVLSFWGCRALPTITIPDSVTSIEGGAFDNCIMLVNIYIGSGLTKIGARVFLDCPKLAEITIAPGNTAFTSENSVIYNKNKTALVMYPPNKQGAFNIPTGVTSIEDCAFDNCADLTGVTIPNGVTSIGERAFAYCNGLNSVTIPNSVTTIGNSAFESCKNLSSVSLGSGLRVIDNRAFIVCPSLSSINIPSSVTTIGDQAFQRCTSLTGSLTIPDNVTSIGDSTFADCALTSVTIGNSVTSIGYAAFEGCGFTSITIPASVTSIKNRVFSFCKNLISVTFAAGSDITGDNFGGAVFPQGSNEYGDEYGGENLKNAYLNSTPKAGTYTRASGGSTWTKQ